MSDVAVYIRVSSIGQNLESQKREIEDWLKRNQINDVSWYKDKSSGTNLDRPGFDKLQKDIFAGKIRTVVVWKLDRLSRSLAQGLQVLIDWCNKGIRVISITQQIDFNGVVGKMIGSILLGIGEMENENRKERQAIGIANAKAKGIYLGRKSGTTKAKPNRAKELFNKGLKMEEIAKSMGVSSRTVLRYLKMGD